jgi:hypothetical protein
VSSPLRDKLTDNWVRLTVSITGILALTTLLILGALPAFFLGGLLALGTVWLVSHILGLRQLTEEELHGVVQDTLVNALDSYGEVILIAEEGEEE